VTRSERILVVEDDASSQLLLQDVLELAGYRVSLASTVEEARARLGAEVVALVLVDMRIPGGGGEALLREMRRTPSWNDVPVVAVTAFAMAGDRERILNLGFDGYVSKPIDALRFADDVGAYMPGGGHDD
jgi:two-component system cell cycle response regulator DivK